MKKRKMDMLELKGVLEAERQSALAADQADKLTRERSRALKYFMGDVSDDIPDITGRSKAVSMDVADTVYGLLPSFMEIFAGSKDAIRFEPVGPEDVEAADQETEYVRHVFWQKNDGFLVLYSMIFDACVTKLGIGKVWAEYDNRETKETYEALTDDELNMLLEDESVEIVEHEAHEAPAQYGPEMGEEAGEQMMDPQTGQPMDPSMMDPNMQQGMDPSMMQPGPGMMEPQEPQEPQQIHRVTIVKRTKYKCAKVMAVPPEEFGISREARCIKDAQYCFHEPYGGIPASKLIADGYDEDQVMNLPTYNFPKQTEAWSRDTADETNRPQGDDDINHAMRKIRVTEHYIRMDYDGEGAKLWRVVTGGEDLEVLRKKDDKTGETKDDIQEWGHMPFAGITPFIMPHRVFGRSVADILIDLQQQKTVILRGLLDNTYAANLPRPVVAEQMASSTTLDDLSEFAHGSVIRTKVPGAIEWQAVPPIVNHVFPVLQYLDAEREWRTGVTRQGQGLDANALNNQTATAAMQLYNASQARMKLIARVFAETGIRDLFWLLHATIQQNRDEFEVLRLTNDYIPVDPRNWKSRQDITISVGLGQGGKAERLTELQMINQMQVAAIEGGYGSWCTPRNLYNTAAEMARVMERDVELFFEDPGDEEAPEQPSEEEKKQQGEMQKAQMQAQVEMAKLQAQNQLEVTKMQAQAEIEKLQAQADIATEQQKIQAQMVLDERRFELDREIKMMELQMKREEHQMKMQQLQQKAAYDMHKANLDAQSAQVQAQVGIQKAQVDNQMRAEDHARKQEQSEADFQRKQQEAKAKAKSDAARAKQSKPTK